MPYPPSRFTLVAILLLAVVPAVAAPAKENRQLELLQGRHAELRREQAEELASLARELEAIGALDAAAEAYKLAVPPDPEQIVLDRLPRSVLPEPSFDLPAEERALRLKLRQLRQEQSVELYLLSRQALKARSVHY